MSEEKLYVLKNDEGKYWDFDNPGFWKREIPGCYATAIKEQAEIVADEHGGHVVTLIEEPKKVVLTKEQAEIVEGAHEDVYPAAYISEHTGSSRLDNHLMEAYVNGYTVEKDKKYNVKVPKNWSGDDKHYWSKEQDGSLTWACLINKDYMIPTYQFTLADIEHYGLQACEKEEVTDDEQ